MTFKQKLLEVLVQLCLVPVSAAFSAMTITVIFAAIPFFIEMECQEWWKKCDYETGESYNVGASDRLVTKKLSDGNIEVKVEHDDGNRYDMSGAEQAITARSFLTIVFRIISLLLSIFALFIPSLKIKVRSGRADALAILFDIM